MKTTLHRRYLAIILSVILLVIEAYLFTSLGRRTPQQYADLKQTSEINICFENLMKTRQVSFNPFYC